MKLPSALSRTSSRPLPNLVLVVYMVALAAFLPLTVAAAADDVTFSAIHIRIDTTALSLTAPLDNISGSGPLVCLSPGQEYCTFVDKACGLICTNQNLLNTTTRTAVVSAMEWAVAQITPMLLVSHAASFELNTSQSCTDQVTVANYSAFDHVVYVTMRPDVAYPLGGRSVICTFSGIDGRPTSSLLNIPPRMTTSTAAMRQIALRLLLQGLGFDYEAVPRYVAEYTSSTSVKTYYQLNPTLYRNGPLDVVAADGFTAIDPPPMAAGVTRPDVSVVSATQRLRLKTPNVIATARSHFSGCAGASTPSTTIGGVLLEEQNPSIMRWERRILAFELLTSELLPYDAPILSKFTVAAFLDMGFYRIHPTYTPQPAYRWGEGASCAFLSDCSLASWGAAFCNGSFGVSYDSTYYAECLLTADIPSAAPYQHIPSSPGLGGIDEYADYCPYTAKYLANETHVDAETWTTCNEPSNTVSQAPTFFLTSEEGDMFSQATGSGCRAVRSTMLNNSYQIGNDRSVYSAAPKCMQLVCLNNGSGGTGGGAGARLAIRVGSRYLECHNSSQVLELALPTDSLLRKLYRPLSPATAVVDAYYYGQVQCPSPAFLCAGSPSSSDLWRASGPAGTVITDAFWPSIVSVEPNYATVAGGETITVFGRNLRQRATTDPQISCRGVLLGESPTDFTTYAYASYDAATGLDSFIVNTTAVPTTPNSDGTGVVDVTLLCAFSGVIQCGSGPESFGGSGYCAMGGTLVSYFSFTPEPEPPPELYFLSSTANQAIAGTIFGVLVLGVAVGMYFYCRNTYASADAVELAKLEEEREEPVGRGGGNNNNNNDAANSNSDFDDDELLGSDQHRTAAARALSQPLIMLRGDENGVELDDAVELSVFDAGQPNRSDAVEL